MSNYCALPCHMPLGEPPYADPQVTPGTPCQVPPGYRSLLTAQKHLDLIGRNPLYVHPLQLQTPQKIFSKNPFHFADFPLCTRFLALP